MKKTIFLATGLIFSLLMAVNCSRVTNDKVRRGISNNSEQIILNLKFSIPSNFIDNQSKSSLRAYEGSNRIKLKSALWFISVLSVVSIARLCYVNYNKYRRKSNITDYLGKKKPSLN